MQHEWGRGGMHIGYRWESQKERESSCNKNVVTGMFPLPFGPLQILFLANK
jgi:hypothetical protein